MKRKLEDPEYLLKNQYQDAENLIARLRLHQQFSTNKYDWFLWVFDQFEIHPQSQILELGCGTGDMWVENKHRIPSQWNITLSDYSQGMLFQAKMNLDNLSQKFDFAVINAQSIPYPDQSFDTVIANHVFHHLPDKQAGLSEIKRVLKPGGVFYGTSMGEKHLAELPQIVGKFDPTQVKTYQENKIEFTLENGYLQLKEWFSDVEVLRQQNGLRVTEAGPFVDYIMSSPLLGVEEHRKAEFTEFVEKELLAVNGLISITKDSGMFIAQ